MINILYGVIEKYYDDFVIYNLESIRDLCRVIKIAVHYYSNFALSQQNNCWFQKNKWYTFHSPFSWKFLPVSPMHTNAEWFWLQSCPWGGFCSVQMFTQCLFNHSGIHSFIKSILYIFILQVGKIHHKMYFSCKVVWWLSMVLSDQTCDWFSWFNIGLQVLLWFLYYYSKAVIILYFYFLDF